MTSLGQGGEYFLPNYSKSLLPFTRELFSQSQCICECGKNRDGYRISERDGGGGG